MNDLLTVGDVARILGCSPQAVRKMERRGVINVEQTWRGMRLFADADVQRLKALRDARPTQWHPIGAAS